MEIITIFKALSTVLGTATKVYQKIKGRVFVKLVTEKNDPDIDDFVELYNKVIDECARIESEEIIKFVGNHCPDLDSRLCDYLFLCKKEELLLGFLKVIYSYDSGYLFIAYLGIDRSNKEAKRTAVDCLFIHLMNFINKELTNCKAIFFEVEMLHGQDQDKSSRLRRFRSVVERQNLCCYQVGIDYIQPEMPSDCGRSLEEEQTALLFVPFNYWGVPDNLNLRSEIDKNEVLKFLKFIYLEIYSRVYNENRDLNELYCDYLSDLIKKYEQDLPLIIKIN